MRGIDHLVFMSRLTTPTYLGNSLPSQAVRTMIARVADSPATVLITGESGTGKELVARALHEQSGRRGGNFVPINCAAIPKDLIESELFGHRKGAFTGAMADRVGRFELAHGGTLFLDEIGDLPLDMQVKLLRVLQERTVDPIGSSKPISIDVRVVAATHRDLEAEIAAGRFREDLYYRLNVLPLHTAPLRERSDDLPELIDSFARRFAPKGTAPISFTQDFISALQIYAWPGNVRELSNLMDRFSTLFTGQHLALDMVPATLLPKGLVAIQAERCANPATSLEPSLAAAPSPAPEAPAPDAVSDVESIIMLAQGMAAPVLPPEGLSLKDRLADIERELIMQALTRTDGNVSQTARLLSLQRTTLIEKIQKYALRPAALNA